MLRTSEGALSLILTSSRSSEYAVDIESIKCSNSPWLGEFVDRLDGQEYDIDIDPLCDWLRLDMSFESMDTVDTIELGIFDVFKRSLESNNTLLTFSWKLFSLSESNRLRPGALRVFGV